MRTKLSLLALLTLVPVLPYATPHHRAFGASRSQLNVNVMSHSTGLSQSAMPIDTVGRTRVLAAWRPWVIHTTLRVHGALALCAGHRGARFTTWASGYLISRIYTSFANGPAMFEGALFDHRPPTSAGRSRLWPPAAGLGVEYGFQGLPASARMPPVQHWVRVHGRLICLLGGGSELHVDQGYRIR